MLSAIISQFKTFFGRAFWFGNLLPVLILAMVHALLVTLAFPRVLDLSALINFSLGDAASAGALTFALLVVVAYLTIPFASFFSGLLDGSLLPAWLYDALRRDRLPAWRSANVEYATKQAAAGEAQSIAEDCRAELDRARAEGLKSQGILNESAIAAAEKAVADLNPGRWSTVLADRSTLVAASRTLAAALRVNTTDPRVSAGDSALAIRLDAAHVGFDALLTEAVEQSLHQFHAVIRRNSQLDLHDWQATRLGDARRQVERYSLDAYGLDFAWVWPRLSLVMETEDAGLSERLTSATAQRDFAVLLLFLAQSVPLAWLPLLLSQSGSLWLALAIGWAAPVVTVILYELVVRSEILFGGVVATAIDRYRLDLLTKLHQPRPHTLKAERLLWRRLVEAGVRGNAEDLVYRPEKSS